MSRVVIIMFAAAAAAGSITACGRGEEAATKATVAEIRTMVTAPKSSVKPASRQKLLQQIYGDRQYRPLWISGKKPADRARALVTTLCNAELEGLRPEDYDLAALRAAAERAYGKGRRAEPAALAALDLKLTTLFLDYGADLLAGRLDPRVVDEGWYIKARRASIDSSLRTALAAAGGADSDLERLLAPLRPQQPEYRELLRALAAERAGLKAGGDRAAAEERIRRIELNLERYRWLPSSFGPRYLLVNIPEYQLYAYDGGKLAFTMRVIVGEEYDNATPVFADSMTHIVFHPRWNVPTSILVREMLPKLKEDDSYLTRNNYEVVHAKHETPVDPKDIDWDDLDTTKLDIRVRQKPGAANALGQVKFMFPNQFAIYLHDTPADELFDKPKRTLSHGCVRVEDPAKLADFVLQGQDDWNGEKIQEALALTGNPAELEEKTVTLKQPIPVYLVYLTAAARDGAVDLRDDPYHKDAQASARLRPRRPHDPAVCEAVAALLAD